MKTKKVKMYILVTKQRNTRRMAAINANKIEGLEDYLPTEEMFNIHFRMEALKLEKDKNYKPKPLYIRIKREIFNNLIEKIRAKDKEAAIDHIPLVFQVPSVPFCMLFPKEEENG